MLTHMDRGAVGWLFKYARKNLWRVAKWHDLDDLLQTGYECYYEALQRYPTVTERPHIMRLFQLIYVCRIADMARDAQRQVDFPISDFVDLELDIRAPGVHGNLADIKCTHNDGSLALTVKMSPVQVRQLLDVIARNPAVLSKPNRLKRKHDNEPLWVWSDEHSRGKGYLQRDTLNNRFCRMIGLSDDSLDLVGMLKEHLTA